MVPMTLPVKPPCTVPGVEPGPLAVPAVVLPGRKALGWVSVTV